MRYEGTDEITCEQLVEKLVSKNSCHQLTVKLMESSKCDFGGILNLALFSINNNLTTWVKEDLKNLQMNHNCGRVASIIERRI